MYLNPHQQQSRVLSPFSMTPDPSRTEPVVDPSRIQETGRSIQAPSPSPTRPFFQGPTLSPFQIAGAGSFGPSPKASFAASPQQVPMGMQQTGTTHPGPAPQGIQQAPVTHPGLTLQGMQQAPSLGPGFAAQVAQPTAWQGSPGDPRTQQPVYNPYLQQPRAPSGLLGSLGSQPFQSPLQRSSGEIGSPGRANVRQPPMDVFDEGEQFVVEFELPGVSKKDIKLVGQGRGISLKAVSDAERNEESLLRSERGSIAYERGVDLGLEIIPDEIQASFANGILTVKVPKKDPTSGPQTISIN